MRKRLISKLEIKSGNVVKPIYFEGLKVIGSPIKIARDYFKQGIDEIIFIDIVASLYNRQIDYNLIQSVSKEIFIPLTVGGGIKKLDDISKLLNLGADKVAINTHALQRDPSLINRAAKKFGSQCIVSNLEVKKIGSEWFCLTDNGRINSGKKVLDWIHELSSRGIGEILIQSVDYDGSMRGFDNELFLNIKKNSRTKVPLIYCSGAGNQNHFKNLNNDINPNSVCVASILHEKKMTVKQIKKILK